MMSVSGGNRVSIQLPFPVSPSRHRKSPNTKTPELRRNAVSVSTHGVHLSTYAARAPATARAALLQPHLSIHL
jgi:hypothetical protein